MAKMKLQGSFVALITPFNADGAVDFGAFRTLIDFHERHGTAAVRGAGELGPGRRRPTGQAAATVLRRYGSARSARGAPRWRQLGTSRFRSHRATSSRSRTVGRRAILPATDMASNRCDPATLRRHTPRLAPW